MKKALDKAISKGGEKPKNKPIVPLKKHKKKKSSPKKTSSKGIKNMKKALDKAISKGGEVPKLPPK